MKQKQIIENILHIAFIFFCAVMVGVMIGAAIHDKSTKDKYGEKNYEFVITDKYEDLGSNYHLVGGRSTEQKYHIVYKYRITNRPNDEDNMKWYTNETTVSGSNYRNLHVGQTLHNSSIWFPY